MQLILGDSLSVLQTLPDQSVQTCVTSPPYFGLRDYGMAGQIGLEETPDAYVAKLAELFREVRRVLRNDGTLWLNLGDSYAGSWSGSSIRPNGGSQREGKPGFQSAYSGEGQYASRGGRTYGLKPKDLIGIPWRVAFALQADGWYLRQDIIWSKPNPMPESVTDRCTRAHEYIFLLSKSANYYFDNEAIKEPAVRGHRGSLFTGPYDLETKRRLGRTMRPSQVGAPSKVLDTVRNKRSVWTVSTKPYKGAHFATFPPDLIEPCILAGAPEGGIVLDPFLGSGTTAAVAKQLGRDCIGIELNPVYLELAEARLAAVLPPQVPLIAA